MSHHESSTELAEREGRAIIVERSVSCRVRDGLSAPVSRHSGNRRRVPRAAIVRALDMTADAVYFAAADLLIVETNAAAVASTGFSGQRLTRMNLRELISDECEGQLRSNVARLMRREVAETSHKARQLCKDRDAFEVRVRMRLIEQADTTLVVALAERYRELDASIVAESRRDFLTGLPSREALEARLRRAESHVRKEGGQFAVFFVDLDDFKRVNDAHGHRMGDQLLRTVAERLSSCLRPGDFVARYGGDEFVVIVEDLGPETEVESIAERIRGQLGVPIEVAGCVLRVSASVGAAVGLGRSSVAQVLDAADRDMYRIKRSNREAGSPVATAEKHADAARP